MKNLMRVISILLAFACIILIISASFDTGLDFGVFAAKISIIVSANLLPIISIAVCAYCLEKNDENYLIRIIPFYMIVPIVISTIIIFFANDVKWLQDIYVFLSNTFMGVTALSLIMVINPNNKISKALKYLAIGLLALNVILSIAASIKASMVDTLPNVYGYKNYGGFNFSTVEETNEFVAKMYSITEIAQIFVLLLLYITNYAFGDKVELETEDIDYEAVKQDAINAANTQMKNIYRSKSITKEPQKIEQQPTNGDSRLMNISNQLGQDSNVGTVKKQAETVNIEGSSLDSLIPLSKGPVMNNTISPTPSNNKEQLQQNNINEAQQQEPAQQQQMIQPNLDIQEQMKLKMQQQNQQNMNNMQ